MKRLAGLLAVLAGAGVAGLLQALTAPAFGGETMLRERLFVVFSGNVAAALLVGAIGAWRRWSAGAGLAAGFTLGALPWIAGLAGLDWLGSRLGAVGVLLVACLLAPAAGRALRLPGLITGVLALATLAVPFAALLALESPPIHPDERQAVPLADHSGTTPAPKGCDYLLIVIDTLRADSMLDPGIPTPNLDALRARGTWAPFAIAPNNQTLPSHISLLAVLDAEQHGMRSNSSNWPTVEQLRETVQMKTLAERFRDAGWRTAGVVSNNLLQRVDKSAGHQSFDLGFETWHPRMVMDEPWRQYGQWKGRYTWFGWFATLANKGVESNKFLRLFFDSHGAQGRRRHYEEGARTAGFVTDYLDALFQDERPYFFFAHFMDPHSPYLAPEPYRGLFHDPSLLPPGTDTSMEGEYDLRSVLRDALAAGEPKTLWGPYARYLRGLYKEEVAYTDAVVGQVLKRVEEGGRPTVILFTADHGEAFGEHGYKEHGHTLHEEEIAVPFVLAGPGVPAGNRLALVPELVDAGRTLLGHAGLDTSGASGRDVLSTSFSARPALSLMRRTASVRDGRWRAYFSLRYGDPPKPGEFTLRPVALHDIEADPSEVRDVKAEQQSVVSRLQAVIERRLQRDLFPELEQRKISGSMAAELEDLGYVDGADDDDDADPNDKRK